MCLPLVPFWLIVLAGRCSVVDARPAGAVETATFVAAGKVNEDFLALVNLCLYLLNCFNVKDRQLRLTNAKWVYVLKKARAERKIAGGISRIGIEDEGLKGCSGTELDVINRN